MVHSNKKLVLQFEYVEYDLKKFMSKFSKEKGMDPMIVKVPVPSLRRSATSCLRAWKYATTAKYSTGISSPRTCSYPEIEF